MTDSVQQCLCGFVSAHQHQLQVHVTFDQEAFGHQADPDHATQHATTAGLSVYREKIKHIHNLDANIPSILYICLSWKNTLKE